MATKKPLVLNGGQIQQLQSGDYVSTTSLFDPASNLGSVSGLATNGLTVHNGTAFSTVSLTAPASGMTITNADGTSGSPTFAFTGELSQLLGLGTGIVAKTGSGTLAARTIQGTTDQITLTNGTGVSGNPTVSIASNPILPGTGSVIVPMGTTGEKPAGSAGMIRYNTTTGLFEFYQGGSWINYGTSSASGTVTSVALALPSFITVTGSPVTTTGTLTGTLASQSANTVFIAPNGSAGAPTFRVLDPADIPNLSWSKITSGTPTTLSGYGITDGVVNTTTVSAGTGLSGGGALSSNVTISMPNVGTAVTAQFVKITTDNQGRVSATTSVGSSDITTALGYTPVNKAGDSMSSAANLTFSGGGVPTGLPTVAVSSTDAVSKAYVDSLVAASATWRNPIVDVNLVDVVSAIPTPTSGTTYIKYGGTQNETWGSLTNVVDNDVVTYTTAGGWERIDTLNAGDRFIIAGEDGTVGTTLSGVGFVNDDLIQYVSGNPGLFASWTTPEGRGAGVGTEIVQGITVLVNDPDSHHFGHTYLYDAANNLWVEIAGPGSIGAGTGLVYSGNVLNVNLGAGIKELPTDEVGIDLYDAATGALILTSDGSTRITTTGGQLYLKLDSTTLTQGANGLKVSSGGITGTELNASVAGAGLAGGGGSALSVNVDSSTIEITTDTLNVKAGGITATQLATSVAGNGLAGGGGTALSVNVDNSSIEINTDTLRVKAAGVTNTMLTNSSISLAGESGTGSVALGGTLTMAQVSNVMDTLMP